MCSDRGLLSAGMVIIRRTLDGCRYLLLRAYRNWDFPKGLIESGEDAYTAAEREVLEETGIFQLNPRWGAVFQETVPYSGGKIARYYLAETQETAVILAVSPELGRPEHHEYRWVSYAEARSLVPARLLPILEWARQLTKC